MLDGSSSRSLEFFELTLQICIAFCDTLVQYAMRMVRNTALKQEEKEHIR